jgi:iron complex transport system substrate-binding protein
MPRIVSLIASATEILCSLGFEKELVGRSHECDFPESITRLPICTAPKFDVHGTSLEIDQRVKSLLQEATSVYRVDIEMLDRLHPDIIVTQAQCEVCAVSLREVEEALSRAIDSSPRVVTLNPNDLADVWRDIEHVAQSLDVPERGAALVGRLQARVRAIAGAAAAPTFPPTVACLEWIEPLMAAGNWVPELVALAGGVNLFGEAGKHSPWMNWEQLRERDPDVIIAMPCGLDLPRTRAEMATLAQRDDWPGLRAVRNRRVCVTDGNQFFNRPGPRLVESLEILAEILHPTTFDLGHKGRHWRELQ